MTDRETNRPTNRPADAWTRQTTQQTGMSVHWYTINYSYFLGTFYIYMHNLTVKKDKKARSATALPEKDARLSKIKNIPDQ